MIAIRQYIVVFSKGELYYECDELIVSYIINFTASFEN